MKKIKIEIKKEEDDKDMTNNNDKEKNLSYPIKEKMYYSLCHNRRWRI